MEMIFNILLEKNQQKPKNPASSNLVEVILRMLIKVLNVQPQRVWNFPGTVHAIKYSNVNYMIYKEIDRSIYFSLCSDDIVQILRVFKLC